MSPQDRPVAPREQREHWEAERRAITQLTIALVGVAVAVLVQIAAVVWWASQVDARSMENRARIERAEAASAAHEARLRVLETSEARVVTELTALRQSLNEVKAALTEALRLLRDGR